MVVTGFLDFAAISLELQEVRTAIDDLGRIHAAYRNTLYDVFLEMDAHADIEERLRTLEENLPRMREMYEIYGAEIRFVPWESIPSEPPCAGVDYQQ